MLLRLTGCEPENRKLGSIHSVYFCLSQMPSARLIGSNSKLHTKTIIQLRSCPVASAMAFQIIASSSSLTIAQSHLLSFPPLRSSYKASSFNLSSWVSLSGSSRFSPYIGLKHMGISISPKSSNPGVEFLHLVTKLIPFLFCKNLFIFV